MITELIPLVNTCIDKPKIDEETELQKLQFLFINLTIVPKQKLINSLTKTLVYI
jgi:predicted nucleic acid-binding protein